MVRFTGFILMSEMASRLRYMPTLSPALASRTMLDDMGMTILRAITHARLAQHAAISAIDIISFRHAIGAAKAAPFSNASAAGRRPFTLLNIVLRDIGASAPLRRRYFPHARVSASSFFYSAWPHGADKYQMPRQRSRPI